MNNFRDIFKTKSNIYGEAFFRKKAPSEMFDWCSKYAPVSISEPIRSQWNLSLHPQNIWKR